MAAEKKTSLAAGSCILTTKISKVEESEALRSSLAVNPSGCSRRPNLILEKLHAVPARAASLDCWL